jgi:phosphatidylglycerol---prolipoprotein diacylglyceryl transferase
MIYNFAYIFWNPKREIFLLPYLKWPIFWYSFFFAIGFLGGIYIFNHLMRKYLLNRSEFYKKDIVDFSKFFYILENAKEISIKILSKKILSNIKNIKKPTEPEKLFCISSLNSYLKEDNQIPPAIDLIKDEKSLLNPKKTKKRLYLETVFGNSLLSIKKIAASITDKVAIYVLLATVVGARLGHILFYENITFYLDNPDKIFSPRMEGLASHGAAVSIIITIIILGFYLKNRAIKINFVNLMDLVAVPTAFAAIFIRIGNFFNQEILGKFSNMPFAIIFGSPADGSRVIPRHPVQLYEAIFYLFVFIFLFYLSKKTKYFFTQGKLIGMFFILIFAFRFFVEFFKVKQSAILADNTSLLMGQYLSIPFILIGLFFFCYDDIVKLIFNKNEII